MSTSSLLFALLFGSIGFGYFLYGKRQRHVAALVSGVALMIYPYFIDNSYGLVAIGVVLMAVPFALDYF